MASKRNVRKKECKSKIRYDNKDLARRSIISLRKKSFPGDRSTNRLAAYKCSFCSGWHVGHGKINRHRKRQQH
jgi:hypothetical protein